MEKNRVVIFAAGTGNPYFTTDTAAALRASEMACEALFKGTKVDGVYSKDPHEHSDAVKYENISFQEVLTKNLKVLDASAISLARDNNIPVIVFSITEKDSFLKVLNGDTKCSTIIN
jgi:uridylate kinase